MGFGTLELNVNGHSNTAVGNDVLRQSSSSFNTAVGSSALSSLTSGAENTALGYGTLQYSTTGGRNTGLGYQALNDNTVGSNNIAIGYRAGRFMTNEASNILIGHEGVVGQSNTIRVGSSQSEAFIAGIASSSASAGRLLSSTPMDVSASARSVR